MHSAQHRIHTGSTQLVRNLCGYNIRTVDQCLGRVHPAVRRMRIPDFKPAELKWLGRIIPNRKVAHCACVQRGGHGQRFKGGAEFIHAVRDVVRLPRNGVAAIDDRLSKVRNICERRPVGVERRQCCHGEHLTRRDIQYDASGTFRVRCGHARSKLAFKRGLHADIQSQVQRGRPLRRVAQIIVHNPLHPHRTAAIAVYETENVRRHVMLRVQTRCLTREFNGNLAKVVDLLDLLGQRALAQIAGFISGQLGIKFCSRCIGEDGGKLVGQLLAVAQQVSRLHPNGIAIDAARQRNAVAVNDIAAFGHIFRAGCPISPRAFK